jgi:hypothetical protein
VREDVTRLLARGGRILGLAAVAHARDGAAGTGSWSVLGEETAAAADEILAVLSGPVHPGAMAMAIGAAMSRSPATAPPAWAEPVWRDPSWLARIGGQISLAGGVPSVGSPGATDRSTGIAALAMAVCRSMDGALALARKLPPADGAELARRARLAGCVAEPGEPSRIRVAIKGMLEAGRG